MDEWDEYARKLLIQKVNIYDRCPSLSIVLVAVMDCYTDVASNRTQDGHIPWDKIYLWCDCHGVLNREFYLNVIKNVERRIKQWQRAEST